MKAILLAGCLTVMSCLAWSQRAAPETDARVAGIVRDISPERIRTRIETLVRFGTRHTLSDTADPEHGIGAARRWIRSEFERSAAASGGRMTVAYDRFMIPASPRVPKPTPSANVVATLLPADTTQHSAKRIIVIGAHYDSRATDIMDAAGPAPGADDDGSGVALVLELARVLSRAETRATIVFICFAGEEQGLFGSRHWAATAAEQRKLIEADLNNDIVGGTMGGNGEADSMSVRLFSEALSPADTGATLARSNALGLENDGPSRSLARYCKEIGEQYVPGFTVRLIYRGDRFLRGGDQIPFHQHGFAAVRFSESKEDFAHQHQTPHMESGIQYGDLPRFVNPAYCARIARVNAAVAASLALGPSRPAHAAMVTRDLAYSTRLAWDRSNQSDVAGYSVRWRETSSPVWQHTLFTPDTTVSLDVSKDDFLFGIQAVDRHGSPSLYAVPLPVR